MRKPMVLDVIIIIIIGGGQASLAMGFSIKQKDIPFVILDENEQAGISWRKRYDSLHLFSPKTKTQEITIVYNFIDAFDFNKAIHRAKKEIKNNKVGVV